MTAKSHTHIYLFIYLYVIYLFCVSFFFINVEEASARFGGYIKPVDRQIKMRATLVQWKKEQNAATFSLACQTMHKLFANIRRTPHEAKYRRINTKNAVLRDRLLGLPGAIDFLKRVNFDFEEVVDEVDKEGEEGVLVMGEDKVDLPVLDAALEVIDSALNNPMFGVL